MEIFVGILMVLGFINLALSVAAINAYSDSAKDKDVKNLARAIDVLANAVGLDISPAAGHYVVTKLKKKK